MGTTNDIVAMNNLPDYQAAQAEYQRQIQEGTFENVVRHNWDVVSQISGFSCENLEQLLHFLKNTHERFHRLNQERQVAFFHLLNYVSGSTPGETEGATSDPVAIDFASILLGDEGQFGHNSLEDFREYFPDNN